VSSDHFLAELDERARTVLAAPSVAVPEGVVPSWVRRHGRDGIAHLIDHTLLKPEASRDDVIRAADEGRRFGVAAVCVNGGWVGLVAERLAGSPVLACAVVGFPLGAMSPRAKAAETAAVVADGAAEVDTVIPLGPALAGDWATVLDDVRTVVAAAGGRPVKVILETAALDPPGVVKASLVAVHGGASFVKTSTGFHAAGGATAEAVELMRRSIGAGPGVKASGGIRTAAAAWRMLRAGGDRIGTSSTAAIVAGSD
jgi:deoxyribose-phosphate aldolase